MYRLPSNVISSSCSSCPWKSLMFNCPLLSYIFEAPITGTRTLETPKVMHRVRIQAIHEKKPTQHFSPPEYCQESIIYFSSNMCAVLASTSQAYVNGGGFRAPDVLDHLLAPDFQYSIPSRQHLKTCLVNS